MKGLNDSCTLSDESAYQKYVVERIREIGMFALGMISRSILNTAVYCIKLS